MIAKKSIILFNNTVMNKKNILIATLFVAIIFSLFLLLQYFQIKESTRQFGTLTLNKETTLKIKKKIDISDNTYFSIANGCLLDNSKDIILLATFRQSPHGTTYQMKVFDINSGKIENFPNKNNNIYQYSVFYVYHSMIDNKTYVADFRNIIEIDKQFGTPKRQVKLKYLLLSFVAEENTIFGFSIMNQGIIYQKRLLSKKLDESVSLVKNNNQSKESIKQLKAKAKEIEKRIKNTSLLKTMLNSLKAIPKVSFGFYFNNKKWFVRKSDCSIFLYKDNKLIPYYSLQTSLKASISAIDVKSTNEKVFILVNDSYKNFFIICINKDYSADFYHLDRDNYKTSTAIGLIYAKKYGFIVLNYDEVNDKYFTLIYGE